MATSMRAAARSAKLLQILQNFGQYSAISRRNYLSSAYPCHEEWVASRQRDPLLEVKDREQLFVDVSKKFSANTKTNLAIDVDIFVNVASGEDMRQEVENLLNKLRRSRHTVLTLPSTACAAVRYMISIGAEDRLVQMLEDRYGFGLFPDIPTINFLLNSLLTKEGREREAVKVAAHMMLQEEPGNEITRVLGLIACVKYISAGENATPWTLTASSGEEGGEEEDDDEIEYVRVPGLVNFDFDSHFDLTDPDLIIGKTLLHFANSCKDGLLKDSLRLVGLARYARWEELRKELGKAKEMCADTKDLCLQRLTAPSEEEKKYDFSKPIPITTDDTSDILNEVQRVTVPEWLGPELEKVKVNESTMLSLLKDEAKRLAEQEKVDIETQKANFLDYVKERKTASTERAAAIDRARRIEALRSKKKELAEKEELYYAFENWNKIEMLHAEVEKTIRPEEKVEEYIPPEVKARKTRAMNDRKKSAAK